MSAVVEQLVELSTHIPKFKGYTTAASGTRGRVIVKNVF